MFVFNDNNKKGKSLTLCNRYGSTCVRTCIRFASNCFLKLRCRKHRWIVKLRLHVQSVKIVDAPHFSWFLYFHQHMALRKIRWRWEKSSNFVNKIPQLKYQFRRRKTNKPNKSASDLFIFETFLLGFNKCIMLLKGGCIQQQQNQKICALCTLCLVFHIYSF